MSKTLTVLRQQTRTYLDEATQADWTDTEVDREINAKYMEVYAAVVSVFEDYYSTKSTAATVANQQEYSLPSDIYKIRRIEVLYDPANSADTPVKVLPIPMDQVRSDLGNSSVQVTVHRSPGYYIRGSILGLIPIPTQSSSAAITLWYIKAVSELSSASDTVDLPFADRYAQLISLGAAAVLLRKGQQEETASAGYLSDFYTGIERMKTELEDRVADDTKMITDLRGEDVDFSSPFWG